MQFNLQALMQKPVCKMEGQELMFLLSNLSALTKTESSDEMPKSKHVAYGIKGIAETFGCSIPTANRIKRSGIIDDAISQVGRKIVIDTDLALRLVADSKKHGKEARV